MEATDFNQNENENQPITQDDANEVEELLNEMRKNGPILAHPMMYVSGLHNKQGCYPVNQNDEFYKRNGISFIELAPKPENTGWNPPEYKYLVNVDESGTFRHSLIPNK